MEVVYYYSSLFFLMGMTTKEPSTQLASWCFGLHLIAAPFIRQLGQFDYFWFYAVWDVSAISICLLVESYWRKILLVLIFSTSFYVHSLNALFWDVQDLLIYTYYQQINVFLLECMIAIVASTVVGKVRRWVVFSVMTLLFIIFRTQI